MNLTHYVYLLGDGHAYKIGVSNGVVGRMESLQTGNPRPIELIAHDGPYPRQVAYHIEWMMHKELARERLVGEWFHGTLTTRFADFANRVGLGYGMYYLIQPENLLYERAISDLKPKYRYDWSAGRLVAVEKDEETIADLDDAFFESRSRIDHQEASLGSSIEAWHARQRSRAIWDSREHTTFMIVSGGVDRRTRHQISTDAKACLRRALK